jgi:hypothetical protein
MFQIPEIVLLACRFVDLDTPLLLANDPVQGGYHGNVSYHNQMVVSEVVYIQLCLASVTTMLRSYMHELSH